MHIRNQWLNSALLLAAGLLFARQAKAQESVSILVNENGTEHTETIDLPMSMTYPLDSLLND